MILCVLGALGCASQQLPDVRASLERRPTAKAARAWQAGEDIPGWETYDYPCPYYSESNAATVSLPDAWSAVFALDTYGEASVRAMIVVVVTDCTDIACTGSGSSAAPGGGAPYVMTAATDWAVADIFSKTGYYGHTDRPESYFDGSASLPIGSYQTTYEGIDFEFCLSRARPDELRGVIYVSYRDGHLPHDDYDVAVVQYPFDHVYGDHEAWADAALGSAPDALRYVSIQYAGGVNYDNAWDWDAITDPDVRAAVYDRFTPQTP